MAIKALINWTHFLAHRHMTNFDELIHLIKHYGAEDLKKFLERAGKNATYTFNIAVVEFVDAVGQRAEECLLECIDQGSNFSIRADGCTDVTTMIELSIFCCWVEDGQPVEHFLEIASSLGSH